MLWLCIMVSSVQRTLLQKYVFLWKRRVLFFFFCSNHCSNQTSLMLSDFMPFQFFSNCTVTYLLGFCNFTEHCKYGLWNDRFDRSQPFLGTLVAVFPFVNNLSHCRIMGSKLFGNCLISLPRLTGSNNCFFDHFWWISSFCAVLTFLNAPHQQTPYTFIESFTLANDQFIKCILLAVHDCYIPF